MTHWHRRCALVAATIAGAQAAPLAGQQRVRADVGAQLVGVLTAANAVPGGEAMQEFKIVQPMAMLHAQALNGHLAGVFTLNLEGWTMPHAELTPGAWGEGWADRRHPHTYVHEAVLSFADMLGHWDGAAQLSISAGKGFVPFGTDDPMVRPAERYPVNHHYSQILERLVTIVGVRAGPAALEGALFNGDEPVAPGSPPQWDRFGDSWSVRLAVRPLAGVEAQGSAAFVASPEHPGGAGLDTRKWSASIRVARGPLLAQLEWAGTDYSSVYVFHSVLAEGAWQAGRHRPYVRFERTERPEEQRVYGDPFQTVRPVLENGIIGATRWTIATAGYSLDLPRGIQGLWAQPFAEGSWIGISKVGGGVFDPASFYGRSSGYQFSIGVRAGIGMRMTRMGTYGERLAAAAGSHDAMDMEGHH